MAGVQVHPAGLLVETEHAGRADHCRWTTPEGGAVQLAAVDPLAARPFLQSPAGARDVADVGGEASLLMEHDEDRPLGERVDVRAAAAARQAEIRIQVVADDGAVDVAVLIHLGSAEIAEVHFAALRDAEGVVQAGRHGGSYLSLIHISEPTRLGMISYAVFCLKKKKTK